MERTDWLLLTIAASRGMGLTPVQLQKSVFLLSRSLPEKVGSSFYHFIPYNYGPFCVDVYRDAETLEEKGLVGIMRSEGGLPLYTLTKAGEESARKIGEAVPREVQDYLGRVLQWIQSLSFPALVRSIYQQFPEFKVNSVFQG